MDQVRRSRSAMLSGLVLLLLLSGCMYSGQDSRQQAGGYRESVKRVQAAVDDYQAGEGLLPILTSDEMTPRYEKFVVDLDRLQQDGYLDEIPSAAFEKGGSAYFLILNEESDPVVKLMDLVTVQKVNDLQRQVNLYKSAHGGELPAREEIYPGLYAVDTGKAGTEPVKLNSVYSGQQLPFMMDKAGNVYADYAADIISAIGHNGSTPEAGRDLRLELEAASYYVPVKSLPYLWIGGNPVAQAPLE
ncbi:hypothetical protein [Paenibacillus sp. MMS20-IR301]|uniref:hypothetical protein n=1 Tax=Paenibacillus sp. MMS20-IR301 TaxID=2895946 RepID=UPI0028EB1765|nr:hypothetical protein [Paenibacillus sp. MMS20-IR301]WNS44484.1 hypothetical protein LOS79_04205 [Paenibacillus sp. MMS20-IR301]